jgi:hypothetical protein
MREKRPLMARRPRRNHGMVFKARVALEAMKEQQTFVELGSAFPGASELDGLIPALESTHEFDKAPVGVIPLSPG